MRPFSSARITRLALALDREQEDGVDFLHVSVKRDVATVGASDHQFTLAGVCRPTDQRTMRQHINRRDDLPHPRFRLFNLPARQMLKNALDVVADLGSQLDPRHS